MVTIMNLYHEKLFRFFIALYKQCQALGVNVLCRVLLTTLMQQRSDTPILH